jgi:thiol-disulfide isomerase/thioredoxin
MNLSIQSKISIFIIIILIVSLIILYMCHCIVNKKSASTQDCNCSAIQHINDNNNDNKSDKNITQKPMITRETLENTPPKNKLCLYYTEWCGYSRQFLPEWQKLKSEILSSELKNKIDVIEYNCENDKEICMKSSVRGYPTVIFHKLENGEIKNIPYDGPRESKSILQFLENLI